MPLKKKKKNVYWTTAIHTPDFVLGIGEANKVDFKNSCLHEASVLVGGVRQET